MGGETILVVDDNPQNLELATVRLRAEGYDVVTAADGEAALLLLESHPPRVIVVDVQPPRMDGLELTRRLKADPRHRGIVTSALTACAWKEDEQRAFAAGCDDYMAKPIDTTMLPRVVAGHLRKRSRTPEWPSASS